MQQCRTSGARLLDAQRVNLPYSDSYGNMLLVYRGPPNDSDAARCSMLCSFMSSSTAGKSRSTLANAVMVARRAMAVSPHVKVLFQSSPQASSSFW